MPRTRISDRLRLRFIDLPPPSVGRRVRSHRLSGVPVDGSMLDPGQTQDIREFTRSPRPATDAGMGKIPPPGTDGEVGDLGMVVGRGAAEQTWAAIQTGLGDPPAEGAALQSRHRLG